MSKIPQLEEIMKRICGDLGIQEGVDITLGQNPARIYFTFENTQDPKHPNFGKPIYLNSNGMSEDEVFEIAKEYGLKRDKSKPKYKLGNRFALGFKLKPIGK